jgi:hypothetical protein
MAIAMTSSVDKIEADYVANAADCLQDMHVCEPAAVNQFNYYFLPRKQFLVGCNVKESKTSRQYEFGACPIHIMKMKT